MCPGPLVCHLRLFIAAPTVATTKPPPIPEPPVVITTIATVVTTPGRKLVVCIPHTC